MFPNSINRRITQTQQRLQNGEFMSNIKISTKNLDLYYGENHALKNINMNIKAGAITAFIGPSGCGKSTFLKTLNRMNDLVDNVKITGEVKIDGEDIYDPHVDVTLLRKKAGMVFQQPNPFPMSIYDNIAYGPRIHGIKNKAQLDEIVETSLKNAASTSKKAAHTSTMASPRKRKTSQTTSTSSYTPPQYMQTIRNFPVPKSCSFPCCPERNFSDS